LTPTPRNMLKTRKKGKNKLRMQPKVAVRWFEIPTFFILHIYFFTIIWLLHLWQPYVILGTCSNDMLTDLNFVDKRVTVTQKFTLGLIWMLIWCEITAKLGLYLFCLWIKIFFFILLVVTMILQFSLFHTAHMYHFFPADASTADSLS